MTRPRLRRLYLPAVLVALCGLVVYAAVWRGGREAPGNARAPVQAGTPLRTGPAELTPTRQRLQTHLAAHPDDVQSAVRYADLALREVRVTANSGLAVAAEQALRSAIASTSTTYEAERMLAAVLLAQHRFREAHQLAQRLIHIEPSDSWLYGVIGDAAVEQGDYPAAFAAFDTMASMRPDSASYARVAYALELQGDPAGALRVMEMARQGASPHDVESQAWHACQVAELQFQLGRLTEARRSYEQALHTFPAYPPALAGRADVQASAGDLAGAVQSLQAALTQAPSALWLARLGDVYAAQGDAAAAERQYQLADAAWTSDQPEPREHALFLARHGRELPRALALARQAATSAQDIFTMDALAWASFKGGDIAAARDAIDQALRTGTRHRRLQYHAAEIYAAAGHPEMARRHLQLALDVHPAFDIADAASARRLEQRLTSRAPGSIGRGSIGPGSTDRGVHRATKATTLGTSAS